MAQGKPVISIAAGAEHSVVAVESGEVYAWGWGRYGNVGDGDRADRWAVSGCRVPVSVHVATVCRNNAGAVNKAAMT